MCLDWNFWDCGLSLSLSPPIWGHSKPSLTRLSFNPTGAAPRDHEMPKTKPENEKKAGAQRKEGLVRLVRNSVNSRF